MRPDEFRNADPRVLFPGLASGTTRVERFGSTWDALEATVRDLGLTPPGDELKMKRREMIPEQWIAIAKRYPEIAFKERDFLSRSSRR